MRDELKNKIMQPNNSNEIHLVNMQINDDEVTEVLTMLKEIKPHISVINLDENYLGDKGAAILEKNLRYFNNLSELSLQFNRIGKEGASSILRLKNRFAALDILLHGNLILNVSDMEEIIAHATTDKANSP
jgi:Ran GTPase-activating protein (RanGAP) involved in mRNA processing and transport